MLDSLVRSAHRYSKLREQAAERLCAEETASERVEWAEFWCWVFYVIVFLTPWRSRAKNRLEPARLTSHRCKQRLVQAMSLARARRADDHTCFATSHLSWEERQRDLGKRVEAFIAQVPLQLPRVYSEQDIGTLRRAGVQLGDTLSGGGLFAKLPKGWAMAVTPNSALPWLGIIALQNRGQTVAVVLIPESWDEPSAMTCVSARQIQPVASAHDLRLHERMLWNEAAKAMVKDYHAGSNPGILTAVYELRIFLGEEGALSVLHTLDRYGVYGQVLRDLYKMCLNSPSLVLAVLASVELGIYSIDELHEAIRGCYTVAWTGNDALPTLQPAKAA